MWGLFKVPQIENYTKIWNTYNLSGSFLNSIIVVGVSIIVIGIIAAPASYVLARISFIARNTLNKYFILGMGVPYQLLLVPLYFQLFALKLINSIFGLILVYTVLSLPFTIFVMTGFFRSLPKELEESAYIDGCSPMRAFFDIMLPLGQAGIITTAICNFVSLWNEFLFALVLLNSDKKFTLSIRLYGLQASMNHLGDWASLFAGFVIVIIPTLVIYLFLSRRLIEGITLGSVKE